MSLLEQTMRQEIIASLTEAEKKVCELMLAGKKNQEIAEELFITVNTVKYHFRNILRKSNCNNRQELIAKLLPGQNQTGIGNSLPAKSLEQ